MLGPVTESHILQHDDYYSHSQDTQKIADTNYTLAFQVLACGHYPLP